MNVSGNKLHLKATPPSEGARRLARWIMARCNGDLATAAKATRVSATSIQRVVAGELVPGEVHARDLGVCADVGPREWRRPARGGWFDAAVA